MNQTTDHSSYTMPGWEPERLKDLEKLFAAYQDVNEEDLWSNLHYFLEQILPVAEQHDIQMAIHPDDPPWSVFGLPRIITNEDNVARLLSFSNSPAHGITAADPWVQIPKTISHA